MPLCFVVLKDPSLASAALEKEILSTVDGLLGAIARPRRVLIVTQLPKTRSGKVLRRSIQALAEGRDPGDLTTLDNPVGIEQNPPGHFRVIAGPARNRADVSPDALPARLRSARARARRSPSRSARGTHRLPKRPACPRPRRTASTSPT